MKIRLFILVGVLCLMLIGGVYAIDVRYSEPTHRDGSVIEWEKPQSLVKGDCPRDEWNWMFEEYRDGNIPKDEMIEYVAYCN